MFGYSSPKQPARRQVSARALNRPAAEVARQARARPGPGLAGIWAGPAGLQTFNVEPREWAVRITAAGTGDMAGAYGWQAVVGDPANPGAYLDVPNRMGMLGTDPLWEFNGNNQLAIGDRCLAKRDFATGEVRAQFDHC